MDSARSDNLGSNNLAIFARLKGRRCAVIGGGGVAERKTRELVRAGAHVTVLSPDATSGLERLARDGDVDWRAESFTNQSLAGYWLIVAATDDMIGNLDHELEGFRAAVQSGERAQVEWRQGYGGTGSVAWQMLVLLGLFALGYRARRWRN